MIEFLKRLQASVPVATPGRLVIFVDDTGKMKTRDEFGVVADLGTAGIAGLNGTNGAGVVKRATKTSQQVIAQTTEANILTLAVPANTLQTGDVVSFGLFGRFSATIAGASVTDTIKMRLGRLNVLTDSIVCTDPITDTNDRAGVQFEVSGMLSIRADAGTTRLAAGTVTMRRKIVATQTASGTLANINFDAALSQNVSLNWQTNNAGAVLTIESGFIQIERGV